MSGFLKELNIIIKRKKISKNKLAAKIDVDPSSFYQMLAGKRYLNEKLFSRLISVLNLSPDEEKYLCELYQILLTGEENYYKSKAIIKFIEEFNIDEDIHPISPFKMQIGHIEEVVYGRENLKRVMFQILLNAYEKNESLKILCQPECESLYFLLNILRDNPRLSVEQIICLESEHNDSGIKNVRALEKLIPGLVGEFSYSIYYFYDSVSIRYGSTSLMPYLILSESMGMIFSTDFESGLFFEDREKVDLFQRRYDKIKNYTSVFTTNDARLIDIKRVLNKFDLCTEEIYVLCPMIPFPVYCPDFWISLIKPDYEKREELIQFLCQENKNVGDAFEKIKKVIFFTREGVLDFYETGHIIDGLSEHFLPVPIELRKKIIHEILEDILANRDEAFLLKDEAITLSRDFYMVASKKGGINCTRKKKDNTSLMLTFFEDSLCHAVCEFMSDLMKSNLVESRETMIEFLEGLM